MSPDDCQSNEITIREQYDIPKQYKLKDGHVFVPKDGCVLVPYSEYRELKKMAKYDEEEYERSLLNIISEFYDKIQLLLVLIGAFLGIPSTIALFIIYAKHHVFDFFVFLIGFVTLTLGLAGVMMPSDSKALMTIVKSSKRKKCEYDD